MLVDFANQSKQYGRPRAGGDSRWQVRAEVSHADRRRVPEVHRASASTAARADHWLSGRVDIQIHIRMTRPLMGDPGRRRNWICKKQGRISAGRCGRNQAVDASAGRRWFDAAPTSATLPRRRTHAGTAAQVMTSHGGLGAHARAPFVAPRSGDPHKDVPHSANSPPHFYHTCNGKKIHRAA